MPLEVGQIVTTGLSVVRGDPKMTSRMQSRSMSPNLAVSESGKLSPVRKSPA